MFYKMVVQQALKCTRELDKNPGLLSDNPAYDQSSVTSLLIYDIFGGEILKTHKKKGWHFYNLIDGERIDFTRSEASKTFEDNSFEDLPATREETYNYIEQEEYSTFLTKFISAYEETVGLEKYQPGLTN